MCEDRRVTSELIDQARRGDEQAFGQLVDRYRSELQVHCYRFLGKHSAHSRMVMGGAGFWLGLPGECLCRGSPGPAEHEVVQDVHGVAAVLAGGVDVAADVETVLGDVVAGQAAGDLLLCFQRPDSSFADVVQPSRGLHVMRRAGSIRIWCG